MAAQLLPTLSYQEGRLAMDENSRRLGLPSVRTITQAYVVTGPLDVPALERAFAMLVARHEALRTAFPAGPTTQLLSDEVSTGCPISEVSSDDPDREAINLASAEAARPFAADDTPRARVRLLRLGAERHVVVLVFDHLTVDAWARGLLIGELSQTYAALSGGAGVRPEPIAYGYAQYVRDQQSLLAGPEGNRLLEFWSRTLSGKGAIPRLDLAATSTGLPPSGGRVLRPLPEDLTGRLRARAAAERVTLFMLLLCALKLTLARRTEVLDQSVAVNVYNRETEGTERLIAPLAELLVVRTDLAGARSIRDALHRVRSSSLDAQEHGQLPYAELVKNLNPAEYADPTVPIGVVLNVLYEQVLGDTLEIAGASTEPLPIHDNGFRPRSELMVVCYVGRHHLTLSAYYQADRLPAAFVEGVLETMVLMLEKVADQPDCPISQLATDPRLGDDRHVHG